MERTLSISKQSPAFPDYLDFQSLRTIGIEHLQQLSGKIWTDHNLHDPGITILEVLSYAITDLGYRNNLDIKDLLTPEPSELSAQDSNFFTPDEILTCNPVTELDIRKRLIDIPGVRNAWLEKINDTSGGSGDIGQHCDDKEAAELTERPPDSDTPVVYINRDLSKLQFEPPYPDAPKLYFKGLYRVLLDLDSGLRTDACGDNYNPRATILSEVRAVLHSYRNLCEDFHEIVVLEEEKIALTKTRIELEATANVEDVLVEIYTQVQNFLAPQLRFYTLQELLDKGKSTADIFAGRPSAIPDHDAHTAYDEGERKSHGFIDTDELKALTLPQVIYASDLYQLILNIPGVVAIQSLNLSSYINDLIRLKNEDWELPLTKSYRPVLDLENSKIQFFTQGFAIEFNFQIVKRRYDQQQITQLKAQRDAYELDLPIPRGSHYDIADHYSIHHDFPLTYGISEDGLPNTVSFQRKAQAKQLKGYLVFFDQLLANYLNQLAQVRTLFSWDENQWPKHRSQQHTYVAPKRMLNFAGVQDIIQETFAGVGGDMTYPQFLQTIMEDGPTANERRHRMLDHLLARFSEEFTDYIILNYQPEYELRLLDLSDATQLPAMGEGLVVIAKIDDFYHVRIFDRAGELVINKGRNQFFPDDDLVQQFDRLISRISSGNAQVSQAILNNSQKYTLIQKIAANLGHIFTEENQRLHDKANFLKDYPAVSRDRFRAINYYRPYGSSESLGISGFQRRLSRMLGIRSLNSQRGETHQTSQDEERFYVLEHVLLRPRSHFLNKADLADAEQLLLPITTGKTQSRKTEFQAAVDPYSFWISVLFPAWPRRFGDRTFRQLIERTVRLEAPAHVTVKTGWLDQEQMRDFEIAHGRWLAELNLQATTGQACNLPAALENLVQVMSRLRSVYPQAVLADAQGNTADDAVPIILT